MDLSRLLRQPIVVEHTTHDGAPDGMGDPTEETTWTRYLGWVWQTSVPSDVTANTAVSTEQWEMALERSAAGNIDAGDSIIANGALDDDGNLLPGGDRFDVDGPPWSARNPRTQLIEYVHARLVKSSRGGS